LVESFAIAALKGHRLVDQHVAVGEEHAMDSQGLAAQGLEAAKRGHGWLRAFWAELTPDEREAVGGQDALSRWKIIAARAD
jgi:hypothetical protein